MSIWEWLPTVASFAGDYYFYKGAKEQANQIHEVEKQLSKQIHETEKAQARSYHEHEVDLSKRSVLM